MAEPSNLTLVLGIVAGFGIGAVAGLVIEDLLYGASIGFALAVVFVAGLMGRE